MAGEISAVLQNIVTRMDSIACDSVHDGSSTFLRLSQIYDPEDMRDAPTRGYAVLLSGDIALGSVMGQAKSWVDIFQSVDLVIAYRLSGDALATQKVIAEDMDRVRYELSRVDGDAYEQSSTTLHARDAESYEIDSQAGVGGIALITVPVRCHYRPAF